MNAADPGLLAELLAFLKDNGYQDLRVLGDGCIVGTIDLMYTRGLVLGLDNTGWGYRFCYPDRDQASRASRALVSEDDAPLPGYVAARHAAYLPPSPHVPKDWD